MSKNQFGKESEVTLNISAGEQGSCLKDIAFTAPFKIMHPFPRPDGWLEVMILSASAGVMAGDRQRFALSAEPGAKARITSQSFEKIHKMEQGEAARDTVIRVGRQAALIYEPLPVIPFAGSAFSSRMKVELTDKSSTFICLEIISGGRKAFGELYQYRYYHALTDIYCGGQLLYRDNTRYNPELYEMPGTGMMEGYSHIANLLVFGRDLDNEVVSWIRKDLDCNPETEGGITRLCVHGYCLRILGSSAQELQRVCGRYIEKII